jgi:hypothetical protein
MLSQTLSPQKRNAIKYFSAVALLIILILIFPVFVTDALALDMPDIHGFIQGNYSPRITGSPDDDFILAEERVQLEAEHLGSALNSRAFFKMDFFHDAVEDKADLELREALVDFSLGKFDFRLGRQIITWGLGDLVFINDAFPKNFSAFFSGRPLEYLKIPSDAVRISFYPEYFSADLVIVPAFEPDKLPDGDPLLFFDPFAAIPNRRVREPETEVGNTEVAFRLQKYISSYEVAVYAFRGFFKQPGARLISPNTVELFFPRLNIYGMSTQGPVMGAVGKVELGYYDSIDDQKGSDPSIQNSSFRFLVAYERELFTDFMVGVQYYSEWMMKYDEYRSTLPRGIPAQDELRLVSTVRLTYFLLHQALKLSLFTFYGVTDGDFYIIPDITYKLTDRISLTLGANVFGGEKDYTSFGQLNRNDNIFTVIRYSF